MKNIKTPSDGIGFLGVLAILFIALKLCDVIHWPWLWVLWPLWAPLTVLGIMLGLLYLFAIIKVSFFSTPKQKEQLKRVQEELRKENLNAGKSKWQIRMEEMQKAQKLKQK